MLPINNPQKHKVVYTWELYDVIIVPCVQTIDIGGIDRRLGSGGVTF